MIRRMTMMLVPLGLSIAGCDRTPDTVPATKPARPAATSRPQTSRPPTKAPRSIMQPTLVVPEPVTPPPPPPPAVVTIPFGTPGGALDAAQKAMLDQVAARLGASTDTAIIRGNTDSRGSDRRNRIVSRRHARLVAAYLAGKGIDRARLSIVALGEDRPVAPNAKPDGSDDPEGRARNRRVDVELVPGNPPPPPSAPQTGHPAA